jgi:hypothetical protein
LRAFRVEVDMKTTIMAGALAALVLMPASASAHTRTKPLKGTFQLVSADAVYTDGNFGKAQLVDGKRNDRLSVHLRHAGNRQKYVFRLESAAKACAPDAPAGTAVPGWKYRKGGVLKTSRGGTANSSARSRTFRAKRGVEYFVAVYSRTAAGAPDQLVFCAELRGHKKHKAGKPKPGKPKPGKPKSPDAPKHGHKPGDDHGKPDKDHGKSGDAPRGNANGHGDEKTTGKPDGTPGNGPKDKPRKPKRHRH